VKCVPYTPVRAGAVRKLVHSCFSSDRINLSPFTKDFRGEEHNEYNLIFDAPLNGGALYTVKIIERNVKTV